MLNLTDDISIVAEPVELIFCSLAERQVSQVALSAS